MSGPARLDGPADVSVVVPVFDALPYLVTCLSSLLEQTIHRLGPGRLELLAVDDGSGDGSGALLDQLVAAVPGLRVVHGARSGGASRPRNSALDLATGRYVFFLDADDHLAPATLERMVAAADEAGADVVSCRRVAVGGRKGVSAEGDHVPLAARSRHDGLRAGDVEAAARDSAAAEEWTPLLLALADCKQLYRADRIARHGLRFTEGMHFGEDALFAGRYLDAEPYLHGKTVVMAGDEACYYERVRSDGGNVTTRMIGGPGHLESLARAMEMLETMTVYAQELRWRRDQLFRDAVLDVTQQVFGERFPGRPRPEREALVARAAELLAPRLTPRLIGRLPTADRVKTALLQQRREPELTELAELTAAGGRIGHLVRDGRVYADLPGLGDPTLPAELFDVTRELTVRHRLESATWRHSRLRLTGAASIEGLDVAGPEHVTTTVVLRERLGRRQVTRPVRPVAVPEVPGGHPWSGFEVELDLADIDSDSGTESGSLGAGRWSVLLSVGAHGVVREVPLGGSRTEPAGGWRFPVVTLPGDPPVAVRTGFSKHGTLQLDVDPVIASTPPPQ